MSSFARSEIIIINIIGYDSLFINFIRPQRQRKHPAPMFSNVRRVCLFTVEIVLYFSIAFYDFIIGYTISHAAVASMPLPFFFFVAVHRDDHTTMLPMGIRFSSCKPDEFRIRSDWLVIAREFHVAHLDIWDVGASERAPSQTRN